MASNASPRTFTDSPAVRSRVPLLIGLVGPSGSGKTYSSLRLATGIQRVTGGDIGFIDTEARRALHYADGFKFHHLPFDAPFGPLDYLAAIEHFHKRRVRIVVVDSMSHEHEGPGGVLEMHESEAQRLAAQWKTSLDAVKIAAWQKPKAERRRLINSILQMTGVNFIFCFRAKEKLKVVTGQKPKVLGWMPIAGEEFVYEMTLNCLLYPNGGGVPEWHPEELGERAIIKLPAQFQSLLSRRLPLSEETGEALARWAEGGAAPKMTEEQEQEALRGEIEELLLRHHPGDSAEAQKARGGLKRGHLGVGTPREFRALSAEKLREGLNNLQLHLEGAPMDREFDDAQAEADEERAAIQAAG